jgi:hypothetical protein
VLGKLRNRRFFSLAELNEAVRECVASINAKVMGIRSAVCINQAAPMAPCFRKVQQNDKFECNISYNRNY